MKRGALLLTAFLLTASAVRAEPAAGPVPPATPIGDTLDLQALDQISGGESVKVSVISDQTLSATSSGNSINADTVLSGGVNFAAGAFSGFNGVGNFVINTGNNNTLQGSLSVNVVALP